MEIKQIIHVSRPPDVVWAMLANVPVVVSCIPGAELGAALGDDRYAGSFKLKVGPLSAKIEGEGQIERDEAARRGRIVGRGVDKRGGSRVTVTVDFAVVADTEGSAINISADADLSGPLAQIGRTGIVEDVARRLTDEFSTALEARLASAGDAGAAETKVTIDSQARQFDAGRAVSASIGARIAAFFKQLFRRQT